MTSQEPHKDEQAGWSEGHAGLSNRQPGSFFQMFFRPGPTSFPFPGWVGTEQTLDHFIQQDQVGSTHESKATVGAQGQGSAQNEA